MKASLPIGLFADAPAFRLLWTARAVSFTGDGVARVALVLLTAHNGPGAVALVLLADTLPHLLGPVAGAIADRVDQRRLMVGCDVGQALAYAALVLLAPPLPVLLPIVAAAGLLATLFAPAGKSSIPQIVPGDRLARANALFGAAFNLQIIAGPALGGMLVGLGGTGAAFALDSASFAVSALILTRLPPLSPERRSDDRGVLTDTFSGLAFVARERLARALTVGTFVFVSFAAIDNVALVFLVRDELHGSQVGYGVAVAAFGAGMLIASLALARLADWRPPQRWLLFGVMAGALGTAGTGLAPTVGLAVTGQLLAGAGNTADLVGTDTLVQHVVPRPMLGRVFGAVGTAAQAGSGIAYVAAAPLVASTGARATLLVAAGGMVLGLGVLTPVLRTPRRSVTTYTTRSG